MSRYFKRNMETYKFLIEDKLCQSMESLGLKNGEYYINCDDIKIILDKHIGERGGSKVHVVTKPTWYEFSEEGLDLIYKNADCITSLLSMNNEIDISEIDHLQ